MTCQTSADLHSRDIFIMMSVSYTHLKFPSSNFSQHKSGDFYAWVFLLEFKFIQKHLFLQPEYA